MDKVIEIPLEFKAEEANMDRENDNCHYANKIDRKFDLKLDMMGQILHLKNTE